MDKRVLKWVSLTLMLCQNAITPIIFRFATTSAAAEERYTPAVAVLTSECLKFAASLCLIVVEEDFSVVRTVKVVDSQILRKPMDTFRLAIPAVLYYIQNILLQKASSNLPAALFQVTYQGKTLVVAFCSVLLLQKQLQRFKWFAIVLMAAGIATVQVSSSKEEKQSSMANSAEQSISSGLLFVFLGCLCSGFAGVYFEMMMKRNVGAASSSGSGSAKPSMWVRNVQLAAFTVLIGVAGLLLTGDLMSGQSPFHGFNTKVWIMVVNNAAGGLCVAFVIKYADNILKGFACALATIVATIASVPIFGFELKLSFFIGMIVVLGSTLLYGGTLSLQGEWWNSEPSLCAGVRQQSLKPEYQAVDKEETIPDNEAITKSPAKV